MSKRPTIDLSALTSEAAMPMPEASQRSAQPAPLAKAAQRSDETKTPNLEPLAFKVPASFRKRFRQRAVDADLKQNELLFQALDAWEEKHGKKG